MEISSYSPATQATYTIKMTASEMSIVVNGLREAMRSIECELPSFAEDISGVIAQFENQVEKYHDKSWLNEWRKNL